MQETRREGKRKTSKRERKEKAAESECVTTNTWMVWRRLVSLILATHCSTSPSDARRNMFGVCESATRVSFASTRSHKAATQQPPCPSMNEGESRWAAERPRARASSAEAKDVRSSAVRRVCRRDATKMSTGLVGE